MVGMREMLEAASNVGSENCALVVALGIEKEAPLGYGLVAAIYLEHGSREINMVCLRVRIV